VKITFFGLTLSSSWGNGHATPYRAILRALRRRGADIVFYEKDVSYYAQHRDFDSCDYCELKLYADWAGVRAQAMEDVRESDIVVTASYTPQGAEISDAVLAVQGPLHVFYDLDTPITLKNLETGALDYLRRDQIPRFDLCLSFTGGGVLRRLESEFGARMACPLYGCVDPDVYFRVEPHSAFECSLSYLGTYAADRQAKLDALFFEPARCRGELQFVLAGSLYPWDWSWPQNVRRFEHVSPNSHPALYSSSRATLNITRAEMAASGFCPSGRFFEAAACGAPILSDDWEGLDHFFDKEKELRVVNDADDVLSCLQRDDIDLSRMAQGARARTLEEHTGERRAAEFLEHCQEALSRRHRFTEVSA